MANDYYTPDGTPGTGAFGASAPIRTEFGLIAAGFDKLPSLAGLAAGTAIIVNPGGTALINTVGRLALAGDFTTTGVHDTTLIQQADVSLTLPPVSGTLATLAGAETLSNKTLVAPALGAPASGTLTNCAGLPAAGVVAGALANGMTATTQTSKDGSVKLATNAYADAAVGQVVSFETGAVNTGTTVFLGDDSIPQNTAGDEYMSLSITPKSATSKLVIEVVCHLSNGGGLGQLVVALFQDSAANALAVMPSYQPAAQAPQNIKFTHIMTSGTTSPTTFKVRGGAVFVGTTTFNGIGGVRSFGGALASSIVIREVL